MQCYSWICLVCSTIQEDLETLLALERANIVSKYHQACQAGSPWDLSLWKLTDHQGFLLPGMCPRPRAMKHCQETWRGDKWLTMLRKWGHYHHSE
ncbi:unnamed protein product [Nyctereutes procyonoides]|uniref:(raccoon dog) hypothetical protein n=1 Tax=Nyctereutes procyonoides TaxID=34880 RepID=A0A811ZH11_NYCPR|nr:unnamed protein product [Nyctereutes procyonoides]